MHGVVFKGAHPYNSFLLPPCSGLPPSVLRDCSPKPISILTSGFGTDEKDTGSGSLTLEWGRMVQDETARQLEAAEERARKVSGDFDANSKNVERSKLMTRGRATQAEAAQRAAEERARQV